MSGRTKSGEPRPRWVPVGCLLVGLLWTSAATADLITVTTPDDVVADDDDCSLREAILEANGDDPNDDCDAAASEDPLTIAVPGGTYTLTLTDAEDDEAADGDLDILDDVVIVGSTVAGDPTVIDGGDVVRVFDLPGFSLIEVTFRDLTITHGLVDAEDGGGIRMDVENALTLERVTVTDNHVSTCAGSTGHGGGIAVLGDSELTVLESTISDNSAGDGQGGGEGCNGGGIYYSLDKVLTLIDTNVTGNHAGAGGDAVGDGDGGHGGDGGGIYSRGQLRVEGGRIADNHAGDGGAAGGAGYGGSGGDGGGIALSTDNDASLSVRHAAITANTAGNGGYGGSEEEGGYGGGIYAFVLASAEIDIIDAVISENHAGNGSEGDNTDIGGYGGRGGGLYLFLDDGGISIVGATLDGNTAGDGGPAGFSGNGGHGGGGYLYAPEVSLERCTITNNAAGNGADEIEDGEEAGAGGRGGGLYLFGSQLWLHRVDQCLIASNAAGDGGNGTGGDGGSGGGILVHNLSVALVNTTVSGNAAGSPGEGASIIGGQGGGIFAAGTLVLDHTTIAANTAPVTGGGLWIGNNSTVETRNSLLSGNTAVLGDGGEGLVFGHDCLTSGDGVLTSLGFALLDDVSDCEVAVVPGNGDLLGVDPALGSLADNGGPTATHGLLEGSPAIDAGSCLDSEGEPVLADQRGVARPAGSTCDVGAFEAGDEVLVEAQAEPPGEHCEEGGHRLQSGLDRNGNGALDADEVSSVLYLCDGLDAGDGQAGADGVSAAYAASQIEAGDERCPAGGVAIDVGLDSDGDGVLDPDEVTDTLALCNGQQGDTGPAGQDGQDAPEGTGDGVTPSPASTCSITENADGSATITCTDGTTAEVAPTAEDGCCSTARGSRSHLAVALVLALVLLARRRGRSWRQPGPK